MVPLYKRGASSDVKNYRGVHLTSHISKVVERILKHCMEPVLYRPCFMGYNQFAYITRRGARDALAFLVLTFLDGFATQHKFALHCGDVAGAFDRVDTARFLAKLASKGCRKVSWP